MSGILLSDLWKGRYWLGAWTAVGLAVAGVFVLRYKPRYEVGAHLMVQSAAGPLDDREPVIDRNFMATQAEIAQSPAVVARAAKTVWASPAGSKHEPLPLRIVLQGLQVQPLVGANVMSVKFSHVDRAVAEMMVAEIIASYRSFLLENEKSHRHDALLVLTNRAQELKTQEAALQRQQTDLRRDTTLIASGKSGDQLHRDQLKALTDAITQARDRRIQRAQRLKELEAMLAVRSRRSESATVALTATETNQGSNDAPVKSGSAWRQRFETFALEILQTAMLEGWGGSESPAPIQQALFDAQANAASLEERLGPKHSALVAAHRKIQSLQTRLSKLADSVPPMLRRGVASAVEKERQLTGLYQIELKRVKKLDERHIAEQRILDELTRVRAAQSQVQAKLSQRQLINNSNSERPMTVLVRTLESPSLVAEPLQASPKIVLVLGIAFGLLGGLLSLTFASRLRNDS